MRKIFLLTLAICIIFFKTNAQIVVENQTYTTTLDIYGHSWDNAIIRNCTFENTILSDAIRIADADNVLIENCIFSNIQGNGIRLHPAGTSNGVVIKDCTFEDIYGNGVLADENHSNTQILNNTFNWIGLDTQGAAQGAPHHGIYFCGNDFLISGNRIQNIFNNDGNGISVRSNGTVRNNIVSDATKNGIAYYSDHPNVGNNLLIENNIVYNCQRGISIQNGGDVYVGNSIVRFNTLVTNNLMCVSIGSGLNMNIEIYGNILIRTDGNSNYIWAESNYTESYNLVSSGDVGFVDYSNKDFHITEQSSAYNFATGLSDFPATDFENHPRSSVRLDAGADQFENSTQVEDVVGSSFFSIFPNPTKDYINIQFERLEPFEVTIYNLQGELLGTYRNKKIINVIHLANGVYFITIKSNNKIMMNKLLKQ